MINIFIVPEVKKVCKQLRIKFVPAMTGWVYGKKRKSFPKFEGVVVTDRDANRCRKVN